MSIGYMEMPPDFKYRETVLRGKPRHKATDDFSLRHPPMSPARWAKIFSPFDALKGFDESIAAKEIEYTRRSDLCKEDMRSLNRKLEILHNLTCNKRTARQNWVRIAVRYFQPCLDRESFFYGFGGTIETAAGTVWNVDAEVSRTILVDQLRISIEDIVSVTAEDPDLFEREYPDGSGP